MTSPELDRTELPPGSPAVARTLGPAFWTPILVGVSALVIYVLTGAPGPYWGDGLELTASASVLGVAHPTGYPLYTVLAHLVIRALGWMEPARATTLMSSVFCAIAVGLAARVFLAHASGAAARAGSCFGSSSGSAVGLFADAPPRAVHALAAAGFAALFALARAVWDHATFAEVYPMTLALGMGILALAAAAPPADARAARRRVLGSAALWGLAALNHYSIILLAPLTVLTLFDWARAVDPERLWRRFALFLALHTLTASVFLLGYLYLPLRARQNPLMNWGDARDLRGLFWMMRGGEYLTRHTPGGGAAAAIKSALAGLMLWPGYYGEQFADLAGSAHQKALEALLGAPILLGGIAGLWGLRRARPLYAAGLLGVLALSLVICVFYRIPDLDGYFLLAIAATLIGWIELAAAQWGRLGAEARARLRLAPAGPLFGAAALFFSLYPAVNKSWDDGPSQWADAVFANLPEGAILLTRNGADSEVFTMRYEQAAKGRRRDVAVYGTGFVFQSWYAREFKAMNPGAEAVELDRAPQGKDMFDQAIFGGVIVPNYRQRRIFTTDCADATMKQYLKPIPVARLLPKPYYDATAYKLNPASSLLCELHVDPADVAMFADAFRERFGQNPPGDPANWR